MCEIFKTMMTFDWKNIVLQPAISVNMSYMRVWGFHSSNYAVVVFWDYHELIQSKSSLLFDVYDNLIVVYGVFDLRSIIPINFCDVIVF